MINKEQIKSAIDSMRASIAEWELLLIDLELEAYEPPVPPVSGEGDLMISTGQASQIACVPKDTIRYWAEEHGIGIKPRGRPREHWKISLQKLKAHIGE